MGRVEETLSTRAQAFVSLWFAFVLSIEQRRASKQASERTTDAWIYTHEYFCLLRFPLTSLHSTRRHDKARDQHQHPSPPGRGSRSARRRASARSSSKARGSHHLGNHQHFHAKDYGKGRGCSGR